jgi:hypothetical protein
MEGVFPEALTPLSVADPEVFGIIEDEKRRQWCVLWAVATRAAFANIHNVLTIILIGAF